MHLRRYVSALSSAGLLALTACGPSTPPAPTVDPATCTRVLRTVSIPGHAATWPRIGAAGRVGVFQVDDGTGPGLPISFGLFTASFNVYRYDGVAETTARLNPAGTTSTQPDTSADGSVVAYATVTDPNQPSSSFGIDVWTASTGTATRITGSATGRSVEPAVSADGRYVAFVSNATTLIPGDPDVNANTDVFLYDRVTSTMRRLTDQSVPWQTLSALFGPNALRISTDGSTVFIARYRADNGHGDLLSIDRVTGSTTVVADLAPTPPPDPNAPASAPFILLGDPSSDGSTVSFTTGVDVPGVTPDVNGVFDVFVWNRDTGITTQVTAPGPSPVGSSRPISIAAGVTRTGRYVVFTSTLADPADRLTSPPAELPVGTAATYLYDRLSNTYVSVSATRTEDASGDGAALVGTSGLSVVASLCT